MKPENKEHKHKNEDRREQKPKSNKIKRVKIEECEYDCSHKCNEYYAHRDSKKDKKIKILCKYPNGR